MDSLLQFLVKDLSDEELVWARKWVQGPLSVFLVGESVSREAISSYLLAKDASIQPLLGSLDLKILKTLYLLASSARDAVCIRASHVVAPSGAAILLPTAEPRIAAMRLLAAERFSFGKTQFEILQDLVYVMQGIDGKFILFTGDKSIEVIEPAIQPHVVKAIRVVSEMGLLIRQINAIMRNVLEPSTLIISLFDAVKHLLWEYQQIAALVDSDLHNWTLIKLLAWVSIPVRKLRFLLARTKFFLLNPYTFIFPKTLFSQSFLTVKSAVESLYLRAIADWVLRGVLPTPGWFFIEEVGLKPVYPRILSIESSHALWYEKYRIVPDRVPPIGLPVDAIFQTGKSTVFLNPESGIEQEELFQNFFQIGRDLLGVKSNQNVVKHVCDTHRFVHHCARIRSFILLSEGAFASALLENLTKELVKPAEYQNKFELSHLLDVTLRETIPDDRVGVALSFSTGPKCTGFDVFSLTYTVSAPIDVVLTPDVVREYSKCFVLLFNSIRRETNLSETWKELAYAGKFSHAKILDNLQSVRADMWLFVHELRAVYCYEVIERAWVDFEQKVVEAGDLDALVFIHQTYLDSVTRGLFCEFAQFEACLAVVDRFTTALPLMLGELDDPSSFSNMESLIEDIHDSFLRELTVLADCLRLKDETRNYKEDEFRGRILFKLGL